MTAATPPAHKEDVMFELTDGELSTADLAALDAIDEFEVRDAPEWTVSHGARRHERERGLIQDRRPHTRRIRGSGVTRGPLLHLTPPPRATEAVTGPAQQEA